MMEQSSVELDSGRRTRRLKGLGRGGATGQQTAWATLSLVSCVKKKKKEIGGGGGQRLVKRERHLLGIVLCRLLCSLLGWSLAMPTRI